ncbi:MAG TPA: signal peptidase I [Actinomycetota bacterium]|nr:signal peptidase I [Actinomycetota bacterium]
MQTRSGSERLAEHPKKEKQTVGQFFKELPVLVVVALGIAILVKAFVVQAFFIPSGSMEDTLKINDRVLVSKFTYRLSEPKYPNVVVFESPLAERIPEPEKGPFQAVVDNVMQGLGLQSSEQDFIKRVIATEGQTVQVKLGSVYVNDVKLDEPYRKDMNPMPDYGPTTVGKDKVFVMGDNRSNSEDSRVFGPIPKSTIVGKAFVLIWPLNRFRWLGSS